MAVVNHVLPLAHHAQPLVVDYHHLHAYAVAVTSTELVDGHIETAVTVNIHHRAFGVGYLGADGRGQAVTHGAEAGTAHEGARLAGPVVLHRPHLVLAHARRNNRLATGEITE